MDEPKISVQMVITDWDWREDSRPELKIDDNHKTSALYIGNNFVADLDGRDTGELVLILEVYRDIFAKGVELLMEPNERMTCNE